jgi:predicted flap endonuclease-1-like 5' DNA nuclease
MLWLVAQMWFFLLAAFLFGAAAGVWVWSARRPKTMKSLEKDGAPENAQGTPVAPATLLDKPDGRRDDLTQIIGIDDATERKLNALGVYHFRQIAAWDDGAARWIEFRLNEPGRVARERWTEQAAGLR